eukprot:1498788-Pleurochrysis_carterae.AAC.1
MTTPRSPVDLSSTSEPIVGRPANSLRREVGSDAEADGAEAVAVGHEQRGERRQHRFGTLSVEARLEAIERLEGGRQQRQRKLGGHWLVAGCGGVREGEARLANGAAELRERGGGQGAAREVETPQRRRASQHVAQRLGANGLEPPEPPLGARCRERRAEVALANRPRVAQEGRAEVGARSGVRAPDDGAERAAVGPHERLDEESLLEGEVLELVLARLHVERLDERHALLLRRQPLPQRELRRRLAHWILKVAAALEADEAAEARIDGLHHARDVRVARAAPRGVLPLDRSALAIDAHLPADDGYGPADVALAEGGAQRELHVLAVEDAHRLLRLDAAQLVGHSHAPQHLAREQRAAAVVAHPPAQHFAHREAVKLKEVARQRAARDGADGGDRLVVGADRLVERDDEHREEHRRRGDLRKDCHRLLEHLVERLLVLGLEERAEVVIARVRALRLVKRENLRVVHLHLAKSGGDAVDGDGHVVQLVAEVGGVERRELVLRPRVLQRYRPPARHRRCCAEHLERRREQPARVVDDGDARAQHVEHVRLGQLAVVKVVGVVVPRLLVHARWLLEAADGERRVGAALRDQRRERRRKGWEVRLRFDVQLVGANENRTPQPAAVEVRHRGEEPSTLAQHLGVVAHLRRREVGRGGPLEQLHLRVLAPPLQREPRQVHRKPTPTPLPRRHRAVGRAAVAAVAIGATVAAVATAGGIGGVGGVQLGAARLDLGQLAAFDRRVDSIKQRRHQRLRLTQRRRAQRRRRAIGRNTHDGLPLP